MNLNVKVIEFHGLLKRLGEEIKLNTLPDYTARGFDIIETEKELRLSFLS